MIGRRALLRGLFVAAAPAIVPCHSLMALSFVKETLPNGWKQISQFSMSVDITGLSATETEVAIRSAKNARRLIKMSGIEEVWDQLSETQLQRLQPLSVSKLEGDPPAAPNEIARGRLLIRMYDGLGNEKTASWWKIAGPAGSPWTRLRSRSS